MLLSRRYFWLLEPFVTLTLGLQVLRSDGHETGDVQIKKATQLGGARLLRRDA